MLSLRQPFASGIKRCGWSLVQCRGSQNYGALKSWTGGIEYDGFKFFPRHPETHQDPPYEPTKLFMVQRYKPFKGNEWRYKRILKDFDLHGKVGEIAILKNTTEVNKKLYKIKHLIKITPIKTPDGVPDDADLRAGFLDDDGTFHYSKKLSPNQERYQLAKDFQTDPARLDSPTLIKQSRSQWDKPW